jgi:hypothetical protein
VQKLTLQKKGYKLQANKLLRRIKLCTAAHLLFHERLLTEVTIDDASKAVILLSRAGEELVPETKVGLVKLHALASLEEFDFKAACATMTVSKEALLAQQSIATSDVEVPNASIADSEEEPVRMLLELVSGIADLPADGGDAEKVPDGSDGDQNMKEDGGGVDEKASCEKSNGFDGTDPYLAHIEGLNGADSVRCFVGVFMSDIVLRWIELGDSASHHIVALSEAFDGRFGAMDLSGLAMELRQCVKDLLIVFRAFLTILCPWPRLGDSTRADVKTAFEYDGEDDECVFCIVTTSIVECAFYKSKKKEYLVVAFEELTVAPAFLGAYDLLKDESKPIVEIADQLEIAISLYPRVVKNLRKGATTFMDPWIPIRLRELFESVFGIKTTKDMDDAQIESEAMSRLEDIDLVRLGNLKSLIDQAMGILSMKLQIELNVVRKAVTTADAMLAGRRAIADIGEAIAPLLALIDNPCTEVASVVPDGASETPMVAEAGVDAVASTPDVAIVATLAQKPKFKADVEQSAIDAQLEALTKALQASRDVVLKYPGDLIQKIELVADLLRHLVRQLDDNSPSSYKTTLVVICKYVLPDFLAGGLKLWFQVIDIARELQKQIVAFTNLGVDGTSRAEADKQRKAEKTAIQAFAAYNNSKGANLTKVVDNELWTKVDSIAIAMKDLLSTQKEFAIASAEKVINEEVDKSKPMMFGAAKGAKWRAPLDKKSEKEQLDIKADLSVYEKSLGSNKFDCKLLQTQFDLLAKARSNDMFLQLSKFECP